MFPAPFAYERPESVEEAVACLAQYGSDARVLAAGQSLLLLLKARAIAPRILIDIGAVADLRRIRREGEVVTIGALATQDELAEAEELQAFPLFADAAMLADPIIRKRGTFVGALAFADPTGDWPAVALAIDAQLHVRCVNGPRTIAVDEFFIDSFTTALQPTDLLTHITVPVRQGRPKMVYRTLRHPASGYALVGVAAVLRCDSDGNCSDCRVAITGAARRAVRARAVEAALRGRRLVPKTIAEAAEEASHDVNLLSDFHAGAEYRGLLLRTYVKRALLDAMPVLQ